MSKYNKNFGKKGELEAEEFLKAKGYRIIENNYLKRVGEIDIITFDPKYEEYVFVEVKTRKNLNFGYPEEAVTPQKINKIIKTAENWFDNEKINNPEWRIDIISIDWSEKKPKIEHIENIS